MPLNDADRDLIARDPALLGLRLALDADALRDRLGTGPLVPRYLRYKPGETCTAHFDDGGAGVTLRAVTAERYAIYRAREEWRRPEVRFLDDLCAVVLPGTLDRRIKAAEHLLDPDRATALLAALIGAGNDRLVILKHKPGRRLVARMDRDGRPFALLKAVPLREYDALLASARLAETRTGAPVLAGDPKRGITVQAWIEGRTANPHSAGLQDFARIGRALAGLHRQGGEGVAVRNGTPDHAFTNAPPGRADHPCTQALAALAGLLPALAPQCHALAGWLGPALARAGGDAPCHGDFSADQVILSGQGVRFIDWDRAAPGPALADPGSFLARLDADVELDGLPPARAARLGRAFLQGYGPAPDIAPWRAAALAALVCEPFRSRAPDWPGKAQALLRKAADHAGRWGALARALDHTRIAPGISAALGTPLRLDPPEPLRDRPGRRALIAYRGRTPDGPFEVYGKLRAKGLDRRTPSLHRRLTKAGFDGEVGVPEALGLLPEVGVWLQERVRGRLLTELLDAPDTVPVRAAGRALARLHGLDPGRIGDAPEWAMRDELAVMRDALDRAAAARPGLRPTLAALGAELVAKAEALPPGPRRGIHRDFYPDQVIVAPGKVWLLDLDLFSLGDPAIDIANFIAHLREYALRRDAAPPHAHEDAFLSGYAQIAPLPDAGRLDVLARVSLARHVWIAQRVAGRGHVVEKVISLLARETAHAGLGAERRP